MIKKSIRIIPGLLAAVLIAGCSQDDFTGSATGSLSGPVGNNTRVSDDPCAIVLMPLVKTASMTSNEIDKSIMRLQQAAADTSRYLPRLERLGWALIEKARDARDTGFYTLAEQAALCIDHNAPGSAEALLLRGHVLHNLHRFSEAEELARRLVEQRGLWLDHALLGDVLTERGALDEATTAYQAVIDQRPGPQAYVRVARLRWLKGDIDGALEMMSRAVRSTSPRVPEAAAWVHVRLAQMLIQVNELPAAESVLVRALSLKPDYPPALHTRGRMLLAQDQPQAAIPLLRQAVQADALPEFRWSLYEALREAGQHAAAGEQEAALRKSGAFEDRRTFALFLATLGDDPETALKLALQELEQRQDVITLDAVAWAMSVAGLNAEALDYSRRALSEGTRDARLYLHAGVIAARAGERMRAHELLGKASAAQQMLLPSERRQLANEFAALQPQIPTLVSKKPAHRINYYF